MHSKDTSKLRKPGESEPEHLERLRATHDSVTSYLRCLFKYLTTQIRSRTQHTVGIFENDFGVAKIVKTFRSQGPEIVSKVSISSLRSQPLVHARSQRKSSRQILRSSVVHLMAFRSRLRTFLLTDRKVQVFLHAPSIFRHLETTASNVPSPFPAIGDLITLPVMAAL